MTYTGDCMRPHTAKRFARGLAAGLLLAALNAVGAPDIGIGAIVVDARLDGKGAFAADRPVAVGDALKTGPAGTATLLFNDESMLTLGPNGHAQMLIYDPGTADRPGKMLIRINAGRFRFFPGKILEQGGAQWVLAGQQLMGGSRSGWRPSAREARALGVPTGGGLPPTATDDRPPAWVTTTAATDTPATGGGAGPIFKEVPPGKGLVISGAMESGRFVATDSSADPPPVRGPSAPAPSGVTGPAAITNPVATPPPAPSPNPPTLAPPAPPAVAPPPAVIAPPAAPIAPPAVPVTPPPASIAPPVPIAPPAPIAPPPAPPITKPSPGAPTAPITR